MVKRCRPFWIKKCCARSVRLLFDSFSVPLSSLFTRCVAVSRRSTLFASLACSAAASVSASAPPRLPSSQRKPPRPTREAQPVRPRRRRLPRNAVPPRGLRPRCGRRCGATRRRHGSTRGRPGAPRRRRRRREWVRLTLGAHVERPRRRRWPRNAVPPRRTALTLPMFASRTATTRRPLCRRRCGATRRRNGSSTTRRLFPIRSISPTNTRRTPAGMRCRRRRHRKAAVVAGATSTISRCRCSGRG